MAKLISINPATGEAVGSVRTATKAHVEEAVKKARIGFKKWRLVSLAKRAKILLKVSEALEKNSQQLGKMISLEMGKPLAEAISEVKDCSRTVKWLAVKGSRFIADETVFKSDNGKVVSVIRYDPVGVVAAIKPWNYPVDTVMLTLAPALLAGNSVIFKPSEYVPLVSEFLVKLIWQAGVPRDGLQLLQGRGQVGAMLVDSPVDMVSFTGSSEVGQEIATKCSSRFVRLVLELGGSSPAIVLKDADLELAANGVVWGRFSNNGQVCSAIKRVFVEESVVDKFTKLVVQKTNQLKVGNPFDKETDIGPLVSEKQLKKLETQVTKGVIQGGRIITGGRRMRDDEYIKGYFHEPTIMIHVYPKMEIMQQETFGPVLPICEVQSLHEAIKLANASKYGLTAAIYTSSKLKAEQAMRELEAGAVYVNDSCVSFPETPWGGIKASGVGVEAGKHGLWEYTVKKHVHVNYSKAKTRDYWFD